MNLWKDPEKNNHLKDNEVHVWAASLSTPACNISQYYELLSTEEKQRSNRFVHAIHRERFIASHGFMRIALASYSSHSPAELMFDKEEKGKPFLVADKPDKQISFNLTHSNELALLAVCNNKAIGIDVEFMNKKNEWKKISKRFYTDSEQNALFSLTEDQQQQAFFKIWTRKEAHMKVTGEGMRLSPSKFTVSVPPQSAELVSYIDSIPTQRWQMQDINLQNKFNDYCACLSVESGFSELTQFVFSHTDC